MRDRASPEVSTYLGLFLPAADCAAAASGPTSAMSVIQPDQSHAMEMSAIVEIVARQPARTAALEPAGRGRRSSP